jgi:hypothetical protein
MKRILFSIVCISFAAAGCASSGHDFSFDTVRNLTVGQSTMSQVRSAMGDPKSIDKKDGNTIWYYAYAQYTSAFPGPEGSTNSSKVAFFTFSEEKLADVSWSFFSQVCTKTEDGGLEWGKPVDWPKMQNLPLNTTPSQVEQQFGPPTGRDFDRNARTTSMQYSWSRVHGVPKATNLLFKDEKLVSVKISAP